MGSSCIGQQDNGRSSLSSQQSKLAHENLTRTVISLRGPRVLLALADDACRIPIDHDDGKGVRAGNLDGNVADFALRRTHDEEAVQLYACHHGARGVEGSGRIDPSTPRARVLPLSRANCSQRHHRSATQRKRSGQFNDAMGQPAVWKEGVELRP
jgi:hypothetical protein